MLGPLAVLQAFTVAVLASTGFYVAFVALLPIPFVQNQVIYLNNVKLTWGQDVDVPEQWGFLRNQVTPFTLPSEGEALHAWHILPLGLYRRHEEQLQAEPPGRAPDITKRLSFKLLRDDPDALLVLYLHGAAGTLGSGHRPPSYRAISAGAPHRIHIVAIDYRGFGTSPGRPSEAGLQADAAALADWALYDAGIPAERIVLWGQSLGTAVATALAQHLAQRRAAAFVRGLVLVAPFADVKRLTASYRIAGTVPLLGPVARVPWLLDFLNTFIREKWRSSEKLAGYVRAAEDGTKGGERYCVSIIHAEDDYDIPWAHSDQMFWVAVNASTPEGIGSEKLEREKELAKVALDDGGWSVTRRTERGEIREDIMKYGLRDKIMGYPVVSMAVMSAFGIE